MKNFVKGMNRDREGFMYLRGKFPHLSVTKVKEGISVGTQIHELLEDQNFKQVIIGNEKAA